MAHKERHTAPKKKGGAVKILLAVVLLLVCVGSRIHHPFRLHF